MRIEDVIQAYGCDAEVIREFDLECESIRRIRGVLRIKTPTGYRMLKRINGSISQAEFLFQAMEHLVDQFPNVPRFIRNKYADPYVVHETGIFYLADWLPGREADFSKTKNLTLAVQALANFHLASAGFDGTSFGLLPEDDFMARGTSSLSKLETYMAISQRKVETNAFEDLFEYAQPYLVQMLEHAGTLANTEYYRRILQGARDSQLLCHGSFHRQNVLLEGGLVSLVDFAHLHQGIPTEDLGYLLLRYLPRYDWDFQVGKALIDSYSEVRELTRLDLHGLALYFCLPLRPLAITQHYFEQSRNWGVDKYCIEFQKALIDEEGREEFVQFLVDKYALDIAAPDFSFELHIDEEEDDLDDFESSSFQASFLQETDWRTDVNQALEAAERAVSEAERSSLHQKRQPDPTSSSIQFQDPQWNRDSTDS